MPVFVSDWPSNDRQSQLKRRKSVGGKKRKSETSAADAANAADVYCLFVCVCPFFLQQ